MPVSLKELAIISAEALFEANRSALHWEWVAGHAHPERRFDEASGKDLYEYGPGLKGAKSLWEGATRPNALFLSMAVQLNSEALRPVFDWFANRLVIFNEQAQLSPHTSIQMLKQAQGRQQICDFLTAADISSVRRMISRFWARKSSA